MKSILAGGVAALAFACTAFADGPVFRAAPLWEDPETGNSFKLRGRLFFDVAFANVDTTGRNESYSASEMRTGRLGVEGSWFNFEYKAEWDFSDNSVDAKDVYIEWDAGDFSVIIGNQKTPNSLEEMSSSRYITFMERGQITDAFRLDRRLGHLRHAVHRVVDADPVPVDRGGLRQLVHEAPRHPPALRDADLRPRCPALVSPDRRRRSVRPEEARLARLCGQRFRRAG